MEKKVNIFGSTGSIGDSALAVINLGQSDFKVNLLAAGNNIEKLKKQIISHQPNYATIFNQNLADNLKLFIKDNCKKTKYIPFNESMELESDVLISAIVGSAGLLPTYKGILHTKRLALANKESMVTAGELINKLAKENNVEIIPVDSEHNAIHQCLRAGDKKEVKSLILTASGGPFFGQSKEQLKNVTKKQALNHPTWKMGSKITIDSATLMNKGLEVIEANLLFNIDYDLIKVKVHPQSIVHSMVEYIDGSIISQMGITNMELPINYALFYPKRIDYPKHYFNFDNNVTLNFYNPDMEVFKCLKLAYTCGKMTNVERIILNGANEIAVEAFLNNKIKFLQIADFIEFMMEKTEKPKLNSIEDILNFDKMIKEKGKLEVSSGFYN